MKKVIVNERVLKQMLMEMTKERVLINEITVKDAYDKFYRNRMGEEIFNTAVGGTLNMTPYHKALLDAILTAGQQQGECSPRYVAKSGSEFWIGADPNVKQVLIKAAKSGELNPQNPEEFISKAMELSKNKVVTKAQVANEGLVKLFENDNIIITCTITYSASKKYFGDSHWCTASDVFGNFNGLCMFRKYTLRESSVLMQFIPKKKRVNGYQIQVMANGKVRQVCNFLDGGENVDELLYNLKDYEPRIDSIFNSVVNQETVEPLLAKTQEAADEDFKKWSPKIQERIDELSRLAEEKVWSNDFTFPVKDLVRKSYTYHEKEYYGSCYGATVSIYTTLTYPYFFIRMSIDPYEFLDEQNSSWLGSCISDFNTKKGYKKAFLCKDTGERDEEGYPNIEFVKELNGAYGEMFVKDMVLGWSTHTNRRYTASDFYTLINAENGEEIGKKTVVANAKRYLVLSDKVLDDPEKDDDYAPFEILSTESGKIILSDVVSFRIPWNNELFLRMNDSEQHTDEYSNGYEHIDKVLARLGIR